MNPFTSQFRSPAIAWVTPVAGVLAAACFAWLACPISTWNPLSYFLLSLSSSAIGLLLVAELYVAATLCVGLATIVAGEIFAAWRGIRGEEPSQIVLRGAVAILCLPPLMIAVALGVGWIAVAITTLLAICLARLLKVRSHRAGHAEGILSLELLFGEGACFVADIPYWRFDVFFLCALFAQAGVFTLFAGYGLVSAGLLATSAALLTWFFPSGYMKKGPSGKVLRQALPFLMVAAFVVVFTMGGMLRYLVMIRGTSTGSFSFLGMLLHGPSTGPDSKQENDTRKPGQNGDYPGVILLPEPEEKAALLVAPELSSEVTQLPPADIKFTGVYWVLKPPDREPPSRSPVIRGSPAKIVLRSADHTPLWMEAHQPLRRPIALNCCGAMQVVIGNADSDPDRVTIEVLLSDSQSPNRAFQSLGYKTFSQNEDVAQIQSDTPSEQTLNFTMPHRSAIQQFDEIIVRFHLYGRRSTVSAKMAVERFRFTAR